MAESNLADAYNFSDLPDGAGVDITVDAGPAPVLFPLGFPAESKEVFNEERGISAVVDQAAFTVMLFLIENAQESVCMTEFEFIEGSRPDLIEAALIKAAGSGVNVKVLVDDLIDSNPGFVSRLQSGGVDAKLNWAKTAHTKMVVIDNRIVLVGSTNLSTSSLQYNREVNLLISEKGAANAARLYCNSRHDDPEKWRDHVAPSSGPITFYGDGKVDDALTDAVKAATKKITAVIYVVNANEEFQDGPVMDFINELGSADKRGVEVNVVMERSGFDSGLNELNQSSAAVLKGLGVNVRFEDPDTLTHAKLLVADDQVVVATGNWSYHGFVQNHDVAIRTSEPDVVAVLKEYAESLFEASEELP